MESNILGSVLMGLFHVFAFFVDTLFVSVKPQPEGNAASFGSSNSDPPPNNSDDDDEHFNKDANDEAVLEAAFKYFDFDSPEEATREAAKKKFRRLSLVHHPDRNNQSEESVKQMQKINRFYELLDKEFDRREGIVSHDDDPDIQEETTESSSDEDPDEPGISSQERNRRRNKARKRRKKQQKEYERRRREMEKEMQREWEETRRKKEEFRKQQSKTRQENLQKFNQASLDTTWGRNVAYETWKSEVQAIEEHQDTAAPRRPELPKGKKPSNPIMDYSTDDVAIALRLGSTDVAIELIHESMQSFMTRSVQDMLRRKMVYGMDLNPTQDDQLELYRSAFTIVLAVPMDEDGNNALHYAAYYEDNELLSFLVDQARRLGYFAEYMLITNQHGSTVKDFCVGSSNDGFKSRLEAFYNEGCETIKEMQEAEAREKDVVLLAKYYFQQLRQHANFEPALFSAYGYLLGRYIFGTQWYETIVVLVVTRFHASEDDGFSMHEMYGVVAISNCSWFVIKRLMSFLWNFLPWWVLGGVILVAGCFLRLGTAIMFLPLAVHVSCTVVASFALDLFGNIVPVPKNQRLAMALEVIFFCSCIILIQYVWGSLPSWSTTETVNNNGDL